jgi:hypothetical protein
MPGVKWIESDTWAPSSFRNSAAKFGRFLPKNIHERRARLSFRPNRVGKKGQSQGVTMSSVVRKTVIGAAACAFIVPMLLGSSVAVASPNLFAMVGNVSGNLASEMVASAIDPATGITTVVSNAGAAVINPHWALAYDPVNHMLYDDLNGGVSIDETDVLTGNTTSVFVQPNSFRRSDIGTGGW